MSSLRSLAYISSAARALSEQDLEALLLSARTFNEEVGVTGVLLYNGDTFFQYFEGQADATEAVFERIKNSSSHHHIQVLFDELNQARYFSGWTMGCSQAASPQFLSLGQAQWLARSGVKDSEGIDLLRAFWQAALGDD